MCKKKFLSIFISLAMIFAGIISANVFAVEDTAFFNFEEGIQGWTVQAPTNSGIYGYGLSELSHSTEQAYAGTGSLKVSMNSRAYPEDRFRVYIPMAAVEPRQTYTINFFITSDSAVNRIQIMTGATGLLDFNITEYDQWFTKQVTLPETIGSNFYINFLHVGTTVATSLAYIDSIDFEAPPTPTPTPEATPTPIVTPTPPILPAPEFETDEAEYNFEEDIHGFTTQSATGTYGPLTLTRDTSTAYAGSGMLNLTKDIGETRKAYRLYLNNSASLAKGDIYTFHVYIPSSSPINHIEIWSDYSAGNSVKHENLTRDEWLTLTYTIPESSELNNMWVNLIYYEDVTNVQYIAYIDSISYETPAPEFPSGIELTKAEADFTVNILGWNPNHSYQIWTYQEVTSGIFAGDTETLNQWILSKPYTLGSNRSEVPDPDFDNRPEGFAESSGILQANIGTFDSIDSNYTVAVKVVDGEGNFVGQYKNTYTPEGVGEAVISKVTVDGQFADEKTQVKQIDTGATVSFMVHGNEVEGIQYSATVDTTSEVLTPMGEGLNGFEWDISGLEPGSYSVTLRAFTDTSSDTRKINFKLYKIDETITYGRMDSLSVTGTVDSGNFKVDIDPTIASGDNFRYRISEPWRGAFHDSGLMAVPAGTESYTGIPETSYGIFQVATYTYRTGVASADDGDIKTVNNARGGTDLNVTVDDGTPSGTIEKTKSTAITLSALAEEIPNPVYSFWRRDANGWVLIRDYDAQGDVTWTPNRVGLYTIQVRAKEQGGLSYEEAVNLEFDITHATDTKANVTNITINQATLDSDAAARIPITITAEATSADEDLLYKYIISNGFIYYVETAYSVDPTYIWVPGKSGDYTISVLVKNKVSFGKYDAIESFTVNVN